MIVKPRICYTWCFKQIWLNSFVIVGCSLPVRTESLYPKRMDRIHKWEALGIETRRFRINILAVTREMVKINGVLKFSCVGWGIRSFSFYVFVFTGFLTYLGSNGGFFSFRIASGQRLLIRRITVLYFFQYIELRQLMAGKIIHLKMYDWTWFRAYGRF